MTPTLIASERGPMTPTQAVQYVLARIREVLVSDAPQDVQRFQIAALAEVGWAHAQKLGEDAR